MGEAAVFVILEKMPVLQNLILLRSICFTFGHLLLAFVPQERNALNRTPSFSFCCVVDYSARNTSHAHHDAGKCFSKAAATRVGFGVRAEPSRNTLPFVVRALAQKRHAAKICVGSLCCT